MYKYYASGHIGNRISRPSYKYLGHPLMPGALTADWMKMTAVTEETELDWLLPERELD